MTVFSSHEVFPGQSDSSRLLRSLDWSSSPLGPLEQWPQSLRTSVSICLNSAFPILVWWGPELVMLYNDAYAPIISNKHPQALGSPGQRVFPEVWDTIGPMLQAVMLRAQAVRADDLLLFLERNGYSEECYFTFSYSPILDESGGVGGVFTPVHETTEHVIGERRFRTLSMLSEVRADQAHDVERACRALISSLSKNLVDLPFLAIYLFEKGSGRARRCAATEGLSYHVAPEFADSASEWPPVSAVLRGDVIVRPLNFVAAPQIPLGNWSRPVEQIAVLPLKSSRSEDAIGFLVVGLNPRKRLDQEYSSFLSLVADHASGAITDAEALEQERMRAEALAEIDRAKTVFFSNISHEFRTPLTLMAGPLHELLEEHVLADPVRERLELAERNLQRLQRLVNNLLDFSRIEAGRIRAAFEPVDLEEFTRDLAGSFRSAFERAGLALEVIATGPLPPVSVDREMWEKIVLNLLSNAFKFTFTGGVRVELARVEDTVRVCVKDTGTGIPASELPHLFQRFHRVHGAVGRSIEGSGIGLALVQELVKLHQGRIEVESQEGVGTTFTVTIPLNSHLPTLAPLRGAHGPALLSSRGEAFLSEAIRWLPGGNRPDAIPVSGPIETGSRHSILLVDDNSDMRQYLARLLRQEFLIETAADGAEGLARIRAHRPDLVLSDVMMPVMNGIEMLAAIRRDPALTSLPVILLSARAEEEAEFEALQSGADDYIIKPFSARELFARVKSNLKIAQLRSATETMLREREEELRFTIDLNPQIPWTADAEGRILDVSRKWLDITGLPRAAALQTAWQAIQHPDDLKQVQSLWERSVRTGEPLDCELRVLTASGSYRWMRLRAYPRRDDFGHVVKWYGTIEDIDDRKQTEQSLLESERRTRVAQEAAGVLIWEWHEGEELIEWGPGVEKLYGRPPDALDFPTWLQALHPDDREPTLALLRHSIQTLQPYDAVYRVFWPDGSMHWLISKAEVTRDSLTGRAFLLGANIDITLRRKTEEALQESEVQLREVLERTTDAVFVLNRDWVFTYLNPNAAQLLASGRDLVGRNIWEEFPDGIDSTFEREYHRAMIDRVSTQFEEYYPQPLDKWFEVHAYPTREGIAAFFRDITTRRKSEQALRQSEKLAAAGRLAASISHEINNPLEAITNLLYLLENDSGMTPSGRSFLRMAQDEVTRVSHIANQTLRFYRQSTRPTPVSMPDVIESVISLHNLRHRNAVPIQRQFRDSESFVAFEGELRQVFANLVGNAADALLPNGKIILRICTSTDWRLGRRGVRISVADNGHGMSRETMQRLFEPFFSTKGTIGTGLGLWVSKEIVEKHGGFIRVRSSPALPHKGTTFSVFLPYKNSNTLASVPTAD